MRKKVGTWQSRNVDMNHMMNLYSYGYHFTLFLQSDAALPIHLSPSISAHRSVGQTCKRGFFRFISWEEWISWRESGIVRSKDRQTKSGCRFGWSVRSVSPRRFRIYGFLCGHSDHGGTYGMAQVTSTRSPLPCRWAAMHEKSLHRAPKASFPVTFRMTNLYNHKFDQ